ncbi:MAG: hypothetical protein AB2L20_22380 [Mangrovibacterium sp.]
MKKIISFSLWGDNPKYTLGALENARLIPEIYGEGWHGRFYCSGTVPAGILSQLATIPWVDVVETDQSGDWRGLFWRFYPASDPEVDVVLSRDVDSRLSKREKDAVGEWLSSDKKFHIMRDHPYHCVPILGGMWGAKKGALPEMRKYIDEYEKGNYWQTDQEFLQKIVYPLIKDSCFVHDSFFKYENHARPFPVKRETGLFVGQVFDQDNKPDLSSSEILKLYDKHAFD